MDCSCFCNGHTPFSRCRQRVLLSEDLLKLILDLLIRELTIFGREIGNEMVWVMGNLIDLETEFIVGGVCLLHPPDLGIQASLQFPVPVFHSIDILICRWICR